MMLSAQGTQGVLTPALENWGWGQAPAVCQRGRLPSAFTQALQESLV